MRPKTCQGRYPTWITVVGYAMKQRRFEELHGKAIRWPEGKFDYIGIDGDQKHVMSEAKKGEVRCLSYLRLGQSDTDVLHPTHTVH